MALLEDIPPEMYTMFIPMMLGVILVAVTVLAIFWIGAGRQRSFEEAKAQASKRAEEMLKGKEYQNSPRAKKGKRQFPRKPKKADEDSLSLDDTQPLKSILKPAAKETTPERSPRNRVEFQLDSPEKENKNKPRTSPPTPHPGKQPLFKEALQQPLRTPQPLFEEPEEEEKETAAMTVESPSVKEEEPKKKPPPTAAVPSKSGSGQKRSKSSKSKQQVEGLGEFVDALPASRISEILSASSLSDEDIQQLFEVLLEKLTTNAEWQAADLRSESAKSLKKHNVELQSRCEEAEKTVMSHSSKIKELRNEIVSVRARHQSSENVLQAKIQQQTNELTISKTRVSGLEEELKQLKSETTRRALQEENNRLHTQMATMAQNTSASQQQLASTTKQLQELQDNHADLKSELQRAREALKTSGVSQSQADRVAELESQLQNANYENENMKASMEEYVRLKTEVQTLKSAMADREALQQKNTSLEEEKSQLLSEMDSLRQRTQPEQETAQVDVEQKVAEEVSVVKSELLSQHSVEVQGLKENIAHLEQAQSDKDREVNALRTQIERCSSLEEQLQTMSEQFTAEQTAKNELQGQLETLQSQKSNGPLDIADVGINGDGEKKTSSVSLEVHEQLLQSKEEELSKLREEKEEHTEQLKMMEKKLEELKEKNNTLRDSCWKTRDEAADKEKAFEAKLKESYQQMEQRCKQVKADTFQEARDHQKTFLQQLFPAVTVETETFPGWLDEFEKKVQEIQQQDSTQVTTLEGEVKELQGRVEELQENEQKSIQEAERFRQTLEKTMEVLSKLQNSVQSQDAEHQEVLSQKEEMIDRERSTNRNLQQELQKERDTTALLQKKLEQQADPAEAEQKIHELEERLHDSEHHREHSEHEAETLRHSLNQELLLKEESLKKEEELAEKLKGVEVEMKAETEARESSEKKHKELMSELEQLKLKLENSENMVEIMKESNRKLNVRINELSPSTGGDSEV